MYLRIALRNLKRNRRRTFLSVAAIVFGFVALAMFSGYINSIYSGLKEEAIISERLGHLTIAKAGFFEHGKLHPERYILDDHEMNIVMNVLKQFPGVKLISPRLSITGMISSGKVSTIFMSEAIDPADIPVLKGKYTQMPGVLSTQNAIGVSVGQELARVLNFQVGEIAVLLTTTLAGMVNALDVEIIDIYNTGNAGTNDKYVALPLKLAQKLTATKGSERIIVLFEDDPSSEDLEVLEQRLLRDISQQGVMVEVRDWQELSVMYSQVKGLFDMIFFFIFIIVLLIVMLSSTNTMTMAVMERFREIGTLRTLGMRSRSVVWLFASEGALMGCLGVIGGILFSLAAAYSINTANIQYTPPNSSEPVKLVIEIALSEWYVMAVFLIILSTLAALWSASKGARKEIVEALAYA